MGVVGLLAAAVLWTAPCEGPDAAPWVVDFRDRVLAYDGLAAFAVSEFGAPLACEGEITMEFDGADYGTLVLTFPSGVTLTVETQPIETSIVTLRADAGFSDAAAAEAALRAYAERTGVSIDWERPVASEDAGEDVTSFRDPDDGLNASAALLTRAGRLVAIRFSMAL